MSENDAHTSADLRPINDALVSSTANGTLVRAVLAGRRHPPHKIEVRPVRLRAGQRIQITEFLKARSLTRNLTGEVFAQHIDDLLAMGWRSFFVATTSNTLQGRVTKRGRLLLKRTRATRCPDDAHDRQKRRAVSADAAFLQLLGVAGPDGRVRSGMQAKYRQIDKFLRLLEETVPLDSLPRPVRVVDLGCGNAALTFATYHHLNETLGIDATVTGVDRSDEAVARNGRLARELGWDHLTFHASRIASFETDAPPHVVLALHACDTASDEAIAKAIGWESRAILVAPCCHNHVQRQLSASAAPGAYGAILRHGILLQRVGDILTDTLRALLMRMHGYRSDVFQFVASEHTPKNLMIRGLWTGTPPSASDVAAYEQLRDEWAVTPKLQELLDRAAGPIA